MDRYITVHYGCDERTFKNYGFLADCEVSEDSIQYYTLDGKHSIGNVSLRETSEIASIYYTENERDRAITQAQRMLDKVF